jgi:hypothetical protein
MLKNDWDKKLLKSHPKNWIRVECTILIVRIRFFDFELLVSDKGIKKWRPPRSRNLTFIRIWEGLLIGKKFQKKNEKQNENEVKQKRE